MVNYEVKGQLAKLLATENLIVEHKYVETASFDVNNRLLVLPMWKRASDIVYDLLVAHEVGHALFTPNEDPPKNIPFQFINVVEDARIEKLMKRRYAGLSKTFYRGYSQLSDEDFFGIESEDLSSMNLADRANLHFKVGNYIDIPLQNDEEKDLINQISECETFADVLIVSENLHEYCKRQAQQTPKENPQEIQENVSQTSSQQTSPGAGSGSPESSVDPDPADPAETGDVDSDDFSEDPFPTPVSSGGGHSYDPLEVRTDTNLSESVQELNGHIDNYSENPVYLEIPDMNLDSIVVSNQYIREINDYWWSNPPENLEYNFSEVNAEYASHKKSTAKEVSYMVKEFECRKSADAYARATTSRTGVLDCTKLHTYKYNEDLFKKITTIPDGKNHGLIFLLDWSGSMSDKLMDTIKQLLNLVRFCKKVNIPFDVYAFTNDFRTRYIPDDLRVFEDDAHHKFHHEEVANKIAIERDFRLLTMLSSTAKTKDFEQDCLQLYRLAWLQDQNQRRSLHFHYTICPAFSLSGTPLNEALACMTKIIPQFKAKSGVQKVQCVILTDGEAQGSVRTAEVYDRIGRKSCRYGSILRNRKTGRTYDVGNWFTQTVSFLKYLAHEHPSVNFIGVRIVTNSEVSRMLNSLDLQGSEDERMRKIWKKERSISLTALGFSKLFVLASNKLNEDSEFVVGDGASKSQIRSAFKKSLKASSMNRKILNDFVDQIA